MTAKRMPVHITSYFKLSVQKFEELGVLDSILNSDIRLFVDPFLLSHSRYKEMQEGRKKILKHFEEVFKYLILFEKAQSEKVKQQVLNKARSRLQFPEPKGYGLGYGNEGSSGSGMGRGFTDSMLQIGQEMIRLGIKNPIAFELVGIFEQGIGCDRISDMVCRILHQEFVKFSKRIFKQFNVFELPKNPFNGQPVILLPKDILQDLPVANSWSDIDQVCHQNRIFRERVSNLIGRDWGEKIKNWNKQEKKCFLFNHPEVFKEFINLYEKSQPVFYNYDSDPSGEVNWLKIANNFTKKNPLKINLKNQNLEELKKTILKIINQFGEMIEYNGLNKFLFKEDGKPKNESAAQLIFHAISKTYCDANNLAIAKEANAGRGPVDFKINDGNTSVVVDLKLSSNKKLCHAYEKQIPIYQKAEGSSESIIVILKMAKESRAVDKLLKRKAQDAKNHKRTPEIIVFDATIQPSASKS